MSPNKERMKQMDRKARTAAKRIGLVASKSRQSLHLDNRGGYRLIDPSTNFVVNGVRFDMSAEDVIDYCAQRR